jgi:CBS domain-containing protein/anti-sigma regulatory factor (Ser/Thr protein kinase)
MDKSINPKNPPLIFMEMVYKMRIKDIMTTPPIVVSRQQTIRDVKNIMKEKQITGMPVAENNRLFGVISMDNIIQALELNQLDDPVGKHMVTNVVVLEQDMPVSMGISYFGKYNFRRFPVLDHNNILVGIITSRDINTSLLQELLKEINKLEENNDLQPDKMSLKRTYNTNKYDFEHAGRAANDIKKFMKSKHRDPKNIRRVAVAAYELEMNQVVHSDGGTIKFILTSDKVEIIADDIGPGIDNLEEALVEGFSTANEWIRSLGFGAGMGLVNVQRVTDEFDIKSSKEDGTTVHATIHLAQ